jgi:hypothetical protein
MENQIISEHVFLFPFVWENTSKQLKRKRFAKEPANWEREYFNFQSEKEYNEFVYFYKAVRAVLYSYEKDTNIVSNYVSKLLKKDSFCRIDTKGKSYLLPIQAIHLKLYKSGIGILSIHLQNKDYPYPEDLLCINGLSKTVYPPLLPLEKAREDYFPDSVSFYFDEHIIINEYFQNDYQKEPAKVADFILSILGNPFNSSIEPIIGSHMFTLCIYQNKNFLTKIKEKGELSGYLERFVLLSKQTQQEFSKVALHQMRIEYIWGDQSVYAMSKYALIYILEDNLNVNRKIYDQLITLILVQRATLLHLSNQIALISTLPKDRLVVAIQQLYEIYNQFINQMYFEEVTESIQGSIIYENLLKKFKIPRELEQLEFEMQQMQEYASLIVQSQSKFKVELLAMIGACLVIPTFMTGFFGMNIFQNAYYNWWEKKEILLWLNTYVALPILSFLSLLGFSKGKVHRRVWGLIPLIGLGICLGILYFYGCGLEKMSQ